ncbi:MAG: hypothetical protein DRP80_04550 [Candidatus Omnitrophota bacterium]|nr:MAG: hypothetical protein DRP80_04550 [Candidatus Omnitrophota bacterium]
MNLPLAVANFLKRQSFVIVSTLDEKGRIHSSAKGIVSIDEKGNIYIIDLYKKKTFKNLQNNRTISITAVDEKRFLGFSVKGKAKIVEKKDIPEIVIKEWDKKVVERISKRLIRHVQDQKENLLHPEAKFPLPEYLIVVEPQELVDLSPQELRKV